MKSTQYVAKIPNERGYIEYSDEEHSVWQFLYQRQMGLIQNRACQQYLDGLDLLRMGSDRIPQLPDINRKLQTASGWQVAAVPALIPFAKFFELLASKRFPAATFIRTRAEIDYLQEPDIFHEVFGHCPLLADPIFADFSEAYGKLGLAASKQERIYLARIYWFTVEFGLMNTAQGTRIYGAGILSSKGESEYSLDSATPERRPFDPLTILRTPYRIDIFQTVYYLINDFHDIYAVMNQKIMPLIQQAISLGDFTPTFSPKKPKLEPAAKPRRESHPC